VNGKDVELEWWPFELRPEPQPTLRPEGDYLQQAWNKSVYPLARMLGVEIRLPPVSPQPHTHLAWEGFQFAREHGAGTPYNHRVLEAFFRDGLDIGDPAVLGRLAADVGLDAAAFREALDRRQYKEAHRAALRQAYGRGLSGVPAFEIGGRLLVGLQSRDRLSQAIAAAQNGPLALRAGGAGPLGRR
jgi:predicted DsbA family dithiol-disulfide isomerase